MSGKRIVLPGGTGYLGGHLTRELVARGDEVVILTRGERSSGPGWEAITWDAATVGPWTKALEDADAIVHLSGKRVDCRATKRNVDELISSRVDPVKAVGEAWRACARPPAVWIQLSSLAGFGDQGDRVIDEQTPAPVDGPRQMVEVCRRWEAAFEVASRGVPRTVLLRPAIAIGPGDPATHRLAALARVGLGGRIASGRQWASWVSLEDCLAVMMKAIDDPAMSGTYHLVSPEPISNAEMMAGYRRAVGRRFGMPSPRLITLVGAWLLGSDPALALTSRRGVPKRLLDEGFTFRQPVFEDALAKAVA